MYSPIHLVFFLLTLLLPADVTEFTVTAVQGEGKQQATWTKTDKGWHAKSSTGEDMGVWSSNAPLAVVVVSPEGQSTTTSFKSLLAIEEGADKKPKKVTMAGDPVAIKHGDGSISFNVPDYEPTLTATFSTKKAEAKQ